MKKKKYLIYTENYEFGGANKFLIDFINLIPAEFDYDILLISNVGGISPNEISGIRRKNLVIRQYRFPSFHFSEIIPENIIFAAWLKNATRKFLSFLSLFYNVVIFLLLLLFENPKIVHVFNGGIPGGFSCLSLVIAAKILLKKTMLNIVSVPRFKNQRYIIKFYSQLALKAADIIVCNSNAIKKELVDCHYLSSEKVTVLYNGINLDIKPDREQFQTFLGWTQINLKNKIIGCVGRFDELKGQIYLIKALSILDKKGYDFRALLVGKGPCRLELISLASNLGIGEKIKFLEYYPGNIEDVLDFCDIFVFPTLHEGFSYSLLEAMKAKCAIVTTDVCGNVEAIDDSINGFVVSPCSESEIAQKISIYLENENIIQRHSTAAYNKLVNKFSFNSKKRLINKLLKKVTY